MPAVLTGSLAKEMNPFGVQVMVLEPGNFNSNIRGAAAELVGLGPTMGDRSNYKDPDAVVAAAELALSEPSRKRRYLVTPNEAEAVATLRARIDRLVQLNEGQPYTLDRDTLFRMLDESLAGLRPKVQ